MSAAAELAVAGKLGNPSSVHGAGRKARDLVERARAQVAERIGAAPDEIVFTAGGTEANFLGIVASSRARRSSEASRRRVLTTPFEHPSVLGTRSALSDFEISISSYCNYVKNIEDCSLISIQLANHELGTLNDVKAWSERAHAAGAWIHTDAVQALGKMPFDVHALDIDFASFSAHKIGGPQGVGALYVRSGRDLERVLGGGHQERERRPGTENLLGVVGFGAACTLRQDWDAVRALRDRLEAGCVALGARVHGADQPRGPNTTNVAFSGVPGDLLVESLDLAGVAASTGAACSSGSVEPSSVILALGLPPSEAGEAVRFSLAPSNTVDEVDTVLRLLPQLIERIRAAKR
jgi:cysteine desulfurase